MMTFLSFGATLPAAAQSSAPGAPVLVKAHKDLENHLALTDSNRFLQSSIRYPAGPRIPDPDDPAFGPRQKAPLSIPLGIAGATQGALVGYLRAADGKDFFNLPGVDGTPIATGAFLGWSLGVTVGIAADRESHPAGVLSALCIAGAGLFLVQETDMEGFYFPLAFLQVAAGELLRR